MMDNIELSDKKNFEFGYLFSEAGKVAMIGNYDEAIQMYNECLKLNPQSAASYFQLAELYIRKEAYLEALTYSQKSVKINDNNDWYKLQLAELYIYLDNITEAIELYNELIKKNPSEINYQTDLAKLHVKKKNYKKAIVIYDEIEVNIQVNDQISLAKAELYFLLGDRESGYNEIKKLLSYYENEIKYYGLLAEYYSSFSEYEKAFAVYQKMLEIEPNNGLAHLSLASYYRMQNDYEKAFEEMKIAFENQNLAVENKIKLLTNNSENNNFARLTPEQNNELLNILVEKHPNDVFVHKIFAEYLILDDDYNEALEQLRMAIEIDELDLDAWDRILFVSWKLANFREIVDLVNSGLEIFPNQAKFYLFKGAAQVQLGLLDKAVKTLNFGKDLAFSNQFLLSRFYVQLGEAYHKLNKNSESDWAFEKSLQLDANNFVVLNNYSFYLSEREENLMKAERMSKFCVDNDSTNFTYLDTYAWVLYRQGNYLEAEKFIKKAIEKGGSTSATIMEHYGDILFKLKRTKLALSAWIQAQKIGEGSKLLSEKILTKTLIE